jgi:transcriptional regulator with XRE-family HTH domain
MGTKAQHSAAYLQLPSVFKALRKAAELTQRQLGQRLGKPQSWVYNCEAANRRIDIHRPRNAAGLRTPQNSHK